MTRLPTATEHQEQVLVFQWAERNQHRFPDLEWLFAIPNAGGYGGGYKANMLRVLAMKREGVRSGVPDLILPCGRGGFLSFWGEMKRKVLHTRKTKPGLREERTQPTPEQQKWHAALRERGHYVVVCWSAEEMQRELEQYLKLPPTEVVHPCAKQQDVP